MRTFGWGIAACLVCFSLTASAKPARYLKPKPKTYNWVYTVYLQNAGMGLLLEPMKVKGYTATFATKKQCKDMAIFMTINGQGACRKGNTIKDCLKYKAELREQIEYAKKENLEYSIKRHTANLTQAEADHLAHNWVCIREQPGR